MFSKILKICLLTAYSLQLTAVLMGCATAPRVSTPRFKETVLIDGTRYISAKSLSQIYNLDYHWDPIAKKIILAKDDNEVRVMVDSSTALVNNKVRTMGKEARFYQGAVVIPQSFVKKKLTPLFGEEYIESKAIPQSLGPIKSVIIDPGHGGRDPGAIGRAGLQEKDVVLDVAKRLKRKLNSAGIDVVLTRASDEFISLSRRSKIANANAKKADFFISVHANAAHSRWINGVEVFYLSEAIDEDSRSFKAAQNYDLNLKEGFSGKNTAAILWNLIYRDNRKSSIHLAKQVCRALSRNLSQRNRGKKPARFYVLKQTNIPAILIEVGFISNPREEKRLKSSSYRDKISQAVAEGIFQYNRDFSQKRTVRY